jgi:putative peptide zinc metalloprotease protein
MSADAAGVLARVWQLRGLSSKARAVLAAASRFEAVAKGTAVLVEGEEGRDAFVVVAGRLEVSIAGKNGQLPVATLAADELFGEIAIVAHSRRTATVTALTPAILLRLDGDALTAALDEAPLVRVELEAAAAQMAVGRFIKSATLLGDLPAEALANLAERVQKRTAAAGEAIVRKGDPGDVCFLVHRGDLEVIDDDGSGRTLATLHPGMLFGEAALLTGAPRNATVRAATDVELYSISRDDVLEAMAAERSVADRVIGLLQARSRPRRRDGVEVHQRTTAEGETIVTLKDAERGRYFRLSREGLFIWNRMDGRHTIRDLTMDLFVEQHVLAPDIVMEIVRHLSSSEFITLHHVDARLNGEPRWRERAGAAVRSFMEWSVTLEGCDPLFTLAHRFLGRYLYTTAGAIVVAAIAIPGFTAFLLYATHASGALLHGPTFARVAFTLIPLAILAIVSHEFGHGMAAKASGALVDRMGLGWYWLRPIVFVDTSDAWLATRGYRMLVDAGGILVNLVLAGIAGFVALLEPNATVAAVAWVFALWSYVAVLRNLNPLLEYDGYYLLMDWLERPNLRRKSLAWLGTSLPAALRNPARFKGHQLELWYGIGSIAYILALTAWLLYAYRYTVQGWIERIVPAHAAGLIAIGIAIAIPASLLLRLATDIRNERANARGHVRDTSQLPVGRGPAGSIAEHTTSL